MKMNGLGISLDKLDPNKVQQHFPTLNEREKYVIAHLTGYQGATLKSLNLISDELKISRERTRQIAIIAIGKMDAALNKDKEEVLEHLVYLVKTAYDGEIPNSFEVKLNHTKLYWKIRGTFGGYTDIMDEVAKRIEAEDN